jgi:hypothetical protein
MIFGWLEDGRTDRWLLVEPVFPWPALHHGRNCLREWAEAQNRARALEHTAGPRRMPWPCRTSVKEAGDAELRLWPVEPFGEPRSWGPGDHVWRPAMIELAALMQQQIACDVKLLWLGDGDIEHASNAPSLNGQTGFIGWQRGQKAPNLDRAAPSPPGELKMRIGGADLRPMAQGEEPWH